MEISPAGNGSFYIYIKGEELKSLPAPPGALTVNDAALLVSKAIGAVELSDYYLELYAGRDSMLLFARAHTDKPVFYTFRNLEELISAAKSCRAGLTSFLVLYVDTYYLIIYPGAPPSSVPNILSEFGDEQKLSGYFALFLSEHGAVLAGPDAIDTIKRIFV